MGRLIISSSQNPRVKEAKRLMKRRERDLSKRFLIEGFRELSRAEVGKICFQTLFICPHYFLGSQENQLIHAIEKSGAQVIELTPSIFASLSYRDRPDGLLAIANQREVLLSSLAKQDQALYVVAEAIEKPGNLGTILRSADGCGADGVIVCDRCTDLCNPNVVRASVGTLFTQPVVETTTKEALEWLREEGVQIVAATPHAKAYFTEISYHSKVAIVVGTEQYGLSETWMNQADIQVKIPMYGQADSLNVSIATSLLLYEVRRQKA